MKPGWTTLAVAALLGACTGAPLPAQEEGSCNPCWTSRHSHDGGVVEIRMQQGVELTEDDGGVRAIRPGGYLLLVEHGTRRPDRRALYTPGEDGGVRLEFSREGRRREPDAGDRAWLREMLRRAVDEGLNAERRAGAEHRGGEVPWPLRKVERLDGDGRRYYARAIESPSLPPAQAAQLLRGAAREIVSEGDLASFLRAFVERHGGLLSDAAVREAFFAAAASFRSDVDRARVLIHVLETAHRRTAASAHLPQFARRTGSDGDRRACPPASPAPLRTAEA